MNDRDLNETLKVPNFSAISILLLTSAEPGNEAAVLVSTVPDAKA